MCTHIMAVSVNPCQGDALTWVSLSLYVSIVKNTTHLPKQQAEGDIFIPKKNIRRRVAEIEQNPVGFYAVFVGQASLFTNILNIYG